MNTMNCGRCNHSRDDHHWPPSGYGPCNVRNPDGTHCTCYAFRLTLTDLALHLEVLITSEHKQAGQHTQQNASAEYELHMGRAQAYDYVLHQLAHVDR
jgi:hypothetical protein